MTGTDEPGERAPPSLQRHLPWIVFVVVFAVYLRTLSPTVSGGDAGELITAAAGGGVAHPPGYPLYCLLGRIFSWIPVGSVAWRLNLLSAACGAGAATFLFAAVRRWTANPGAGLLSAGLFAFSPLVWRYAVTAEVFALNDLVLSTLLWLGVRHAERRDVTGLAALAAVAGLGVSNHHASVLFSAPLGIWAIWTARGALASGGAAAAALRALPVTAAGAAGLLPYAYLPIAAAARPRDSWGAPDTLGGFLDHFLRMDYGTFRLGNFGESGRDLAEGLRRYAASLPGELTPVALVLAVAGAWAFLRRERLGGPTLPAAASFVLYVLVFEGLANLPLDVPLYREVHARFWQQPNLAVAAAAGLGFEAAAAALRRPSWKVLLAIGILAAAGQAGLHFRGADQSENRVVATFGRSYLESLPPRSILISRGDLTLHTLRYLQRFERVRRDVRVLDREMLAEPWFTRQILDHDPDVVLPGFRYGRGGPSGYTLRNLIAANIDRFPIFLTSLEPEESDRTWEAEFELWPFSYANRVYPRGSVLDLEALLSAHERALAGLDFGSPDAYRDGSWERVAVRFYWHSRFAPGQALISRAVATSGETRRLLFSLAAASLDRLVREHPDPPYPYFKYLGVAYQELSMDEERREAFSRYLLTAPPGDPGYEAIRSAATAR